MKNAARTFEANRATIRIVELVSKYARQVQPVMVLELLGLCKSSERENH